MKAKAKKSANTSKPKPAPKRRGGQPKHQPAAPLAMIQKSTAAKKASPATIYTVGVGVGKRLMPVQKLKALCSAIDVQAVQDWRSDLGVLDAATLTTELPGYSHVGNAWNADVIPPGAISSLAAASVPTLLLFNVPAPGACTRHSQLALPLANQHGATVVHVFQDELIDAVEFQRSLDEDDDYVCETWEWDPVPTLGPATDLTAVKPNLELASGQTIADKAMLVRLTIHMWEAVIQDKKVGREVAKQHGADEEMGRYSKRLLCKDALAKVKSIYDKLRDEHNRMTLPWQDGGQRVLNATAYFDYNKRINELIREAETELTTNLYPNYEHLKAEAKKKLNGLANDADWPTLAVLKRKFGVDVAVDPVPTANDFRVVSYLDDAAISQIRGDIEDRVKATLQDGIADVWLKIRDLLRRLADRIKQYDPDDKETQTISQPLVDAIDAVLDMVPVLNITNDPALERYADAIRADITAFSAKQLRELPSVRDEVAKRADAILESISEFF